MYPDWSVIAIGALTVILIWQGVFTFFLISERKFLKSLFPKSGERDVRKKFEEIAGVVEGFDGRVDILQGKIDFLSKVSVKFTQRMFLQRYNPYNDTGGDQSFSIAFLDREGNGMIVTSLHTRSGTRVYGKPVILGRPGKYSFSKEEEDTIKKALQ